MHSLWASVEEMDHDCFGHLYMEYSIDYDTIDNEEGDIWLP